jgi:hypothetical protein
MEYWIVSAVFGTISGAVLTLISIGIDYLHNGSLMPTFLIVASFFIGALAMTIGMRIKFHFDD